MEYVPPIGAADPNDPYVDANPGAGQEGSPVPAAAIEHAQREIVNAIVAAGLVPDGGDLTQLTAAIQALIAAAPDIRAMDVAFMAGFGPDGAGEDLAVQTYGYLVAARAFKITGVAGYIEAAGTGAAVIVDIELNGATIFLTRPQFADGANALTPGDFLASAASIAVAAGDRIAFKVTQIGSTVAGQRLGLTLLASA